MSKFKLVVKDWMVGASVDVRTAKGRFITQLEWIGGEFMHKGKLYELRGPYHGLKKYHVFELVEQTVEIEEVRV